MVSIVSLWLPILLSAVIVFIASSIIHMALGYHAGDFRKVPKEAEVMDALRPFDIPEGNYSMPRAASMKDMNSPEYKEKLNKGPVAMLIVSQSGPQSMVKGLVSWFIFSIVVGIFAYVAGRALEPGAHYLEVFRFVGVTSFLGYGLALAHNSIWYNISWSSTIKYMFDSLVYGLLTAGVFGWLWPSM